MALFALLPQSDFSFVMWRFSLLVPGAVLTKCSLDVIARREPIFTFVIQVILMSEQARCVTSHLKRGLTSSAVTGSPSRRSLASPQATPSVVYATRTDRIFRFGHESRQLVLSKPEPEMNVKIRLRSVWRVHKVITLKGHIGNDQSIPGSFQRYQAS